MFCLKSLCLRWVRLSGLDVPSVANKASDMASTIPEAELASSTASVDLNSPAPADDSHQQEESSPQQESQETQDDGYFFVCLLTLQY